MAKWEVSPHPRCDKKTRRHPRGASWRKHVRCQLNAGRVFQDSRPIPLVYRGLSPSAIGRKIVQVQKTPTCLWKCILIPSESSSDVDCSGSDFAPKLESQRIPGSRRRARNHDYSGSVLGKRSFSELFDGRGIACHRLRPLTGNQRETQFSSGRPTAESLLMFIANDLPSNRLASGSRISCSRCNSETAAANLRP